MSWTPDIWIKREDFEKEKEKLSAYNVWEFDIADVKGVVMNAGGFSFSYKDLHAILEEKNIPHWLLNSEGSHCDNCHDWGQQLYEKEDD